MFTTLTEKQLNRYMKLAKEYAQLKAQGKRREACGVAQKINRMGLPEPEVFSSSVIKHNFDVMG